MNLKYFENDPTKLTEYLNIEDRYTKRTALHMAGIFGNSELIEEIIRGGADPTKVDYVNCNIFHHTVGNGKLFVYVSSLKTMRAKREWYEFDAFMHFSI